MLLWGRLRLPAARVAATVERRLPGARWRRLLVVHTGGRSTFTRRVPAAPGARYRVRAGGVTGLPVPVRP